MELSAVEDISIDQRIAQRLRALRSERSWSLEELSRRSGVSRATLSRLENAEVSPTASVLGKLASAFGLTISRLMRLAEDDFAPLIRRGAQEVWTDAETGFRRRTVSPPAQMLSGEVLEGELPAGVAISYERPPRPGLEHHLVLLEGQLHVTVGGQTHELRPGDCLRYQLHGASTIATLASSGARYFLFIM